MKAIKKAIKLAVATFILPGIALANTDIEEEILDSAVCSVSIGMSYGLEEKHKENKKLDEIVQYYDRVGREHASSLNVSYEKYVVEFLHHIQKTSNKSEAKKAASSCIADYVLNYEK